MGEKGTGGGGDEVARGEVGGVDKRRGARGTSCGRGMRDIGEEGSVVGPGGVVGVD